MLHYAWYASNLCDNREIFMNVNEACFPVDAIKKPCKCEKSAFIRCARCPETFCFPCFVEEYHSDSCDTP